MQTKVTLSDCFNKDLKPLTAKSAEDIAKGIKNHCFIYYLCDEFPTVNVVETIEGKNVSTSVNSFFKIESKDKEKDIFVRDKAFKLYIMKSPKITFQNLLKNVEKRMSPFFDHLFAEKV